MAELAERARDYATRAHQRIGQQRRYSEQPYHVHLEAVARLVASVSAATEMIAAAWLHDTAEDTPATLDDIEAEFGAAVADEPATAGSAASLASHGSTAPGFRNLALSGINAALEKRRAISYLYGTASNPACRGTESAYGAR